MIDVEYAILEAYLKDEITTTQYQTLIGLCRHDDELGALKGLMKIKRRNKRQSQRAV